MGRQLLADGRLTLVSLLTQSSWQSRTKNYRLMPIPLEEKARPLVDANGNNPNSGFL